MNEEWVHILPDYKVSNLGRVMTVKTGYISYGGNVKGYKNIKTSSGKMYVHRLVGMAFLNRKDVNDVINHKNGVKTDNRVENLEWVSQMDNIRHSKNMPNYQSKLKNRFPIHQTIEILKLHYVYGLGYQCIGELYNRSPFSIRKIVKFQTHHLEQAITL